MKQCKDYESALSSDCACCDKKCEFRKMGNPLSTAFGCMLIVFVIIIFIQIIKGIMK